jgi:peptidoglycan-associated lipoprotein
MHKKLHVAIILFVILPVLIFLPACSKKTTETAESGITTQEEDMPAQKTAEQLAQERQEREAEMRGFRAGKIKFMSEDIYFKKGSYKLMPKARELLLSKALWLQKNSDLKVIVEGHTHEAGSKEYVFALGDQRAGAVKTFLIGQGIQSGRIIAVSYGNEQPIVSGSTKSARSKNRRVHFIVEE